MRSSRKTGADRLSVSHHLDRTRFDHSEMEFTACHTAEMDMLDMRAYDGEELSHLDRTVHFPEQLELSSSREDKDDEVFLDLEPDLPPSSNDTFKMSSKACDRTRIFTSEGADMEETGIFNGTLSDMSAYFQDKMCENDLRDRNNGPYNPTIFKSTRTSNFEKTPNDVSEKSSKDFDQTKIFTSEGAEMEETHVFSGTLTELTTDLRSMISQKKLEGENRAQNKDIIPRTYGMNNLEKTTIFSPTGGAMEEIELFDKSDLFTSKRLVDKLSKENLDWENMSTRVYTDSYVMSILEKSDFQSFREEQRKNPGSNDEDCMKEFDTRSFLAHLGGNKQKDVSLSIESRPNLGSNYVDRMQEVDANSFLSHLDGLKQKDALLSTEYRLPQSEDDLSGVLCSSSVSAAVPKTFDTLMFLNDLDKNTSFSTEPRAKSLSRASTKSTTLDEENGQQAKMLDQDKVRMQEESIPVQLHEEKFTNDRIFEGKKVVAPKRGIYIKVGGSKSTSESKGTSEDKNDNGGPTKKSRIGSWSETQIETVPVSISNETINTQTNVSVDQPLRQFRDTVGPTMNELNSQVTNEICAEMSKKYSEFDSPEKPTKSLMHSRLEDRTIDLLNKDFSAIEMRVHDNSFEDFELENISKLIPFGFNDMSRLKNSTAMLDLTQHDQGCRIGEVSRGIMSITQMNFTSILGDDLVNNSAMIAQMPLLKGSDSMFAEEPEMNSICIEQEDLDVSRRCGNPDKVSDSANERRSEVWNNMTTCVYSKSFLESLDQKVEAGDPRAELAQVLRNDDTEIEKSSSEKQIETVTTNFEAESASVETETVEMVTTDVENEIKIGETETQKDETAETQQIEPETLRVECGTTMIAEQNFELESMVIETTQFVEMEIDSQRFLPEPSVVGEKLVETENLSSAADTENIPDNRISSPHYDESISTKRFLNVSNDEILKSCQANQNSSIEPEVKRLKLQNVENDIIPKVQSSNDNDSTMASTSFSSKFADCINSFKPSLFASSQSSDGRSLTEPTSSSSHSVDGRSLMEPISSLSHSVDGRSLMEPISSSSHSVDGRSLNEPISSSSRSLHGKSLTESTSSSSHSVDGRSLTESSRSLSRPAKNTCLTSTSSYLKSVSCFTNMT